MMTNTVTMTKNEDGNQEEHLKNHSKLDNEIIAEEKLTLPNVDAEADPSAASEAVAVDGGIGKQEKDQVQAGPSDVEKALAVIRRIQAAFRGHLARRAFRSLKGLVKLQAVVRGVVVRRQAHMALHCMRACSSWGSGSSQADQPIPKHRVIHSDHEHLNQRIWGSSNNNLIMS